MPKKHETLGYRACVGIMLLDRSGRVWVGRRADLVPRPGLETWWQMPQGGIDEGEDAAAAARRELYEETGIRSADILAQSQDWHYYDLPAHLLGVSWGGRYRGQKQLWFAMRFTGEEGEIDISPRPGHKQEFDAWRWVSLGDLIGLIVPFKRDVYEKVVAEFRHLAEAAP